MRCLWLPGAMAMVVASAHGQQWIGLDGPQGPGRGFVWDSWRGRAVMFGTDGETWEWDGLRYQHRPTDVAPSPRTAPAMAFDSIRGHTLLFGGGLPIGHGIADTWTWDGSQWRQPFSLLAPSRRSGSAMTFDSLRGRVVLFGGCDTTLTLFADTWEHDGAQWQPCQPANAPPACCNAGLCFDSARGVSVLLMSLGIVAQTWEWNGVDWTQRATGGPLVSNGAALAYDPVRQRTVMYGGDLLNEVWEWDGASWLLRSTVGQGRRGHGMAFDDRGRRVLIAGGYDGGTAATDILAWSGTSMSTVAASLRPSQRAAPAVSFDSQRQRLVLSGGVVGGAIGDDLWEWDGAAWLQVNVSPRPPARYGAACCYDPARARTVVFSGLQGGQGWLADCWTWDGSTWSSVAAQLPPARYLAAMTWDSIRQRAVLYGGEGTGGALGDTWSWNGAAWQNLAPSASPGPRWAHGLAFDPVRNRVVLHGGMQGQVALSDTWEFDGIRWSQVVTAAAPEPGAASMAFDVQSGTVALVGISSTPFRHVERWDYGGTDWVPGPQFALSFSASILMAVADASRQRIFLHDGQTLRTCADVAPSTTAYGQGCGNPEPRLSASTLPLVGERSFGLEAFGRPGMPVVFALAAASGNAASGPGCWLLLQQVVATVIAPADPFGLAMQPIPLPTDHALRGVVLFAQAGVLAPASPGGFVMSGGLRIAVGD